MSTANLPAMLPANANLPANYEAAKKALQECVRVDEAKKLARQSRGPAVIPGAVFLSPL